MKKILVTGGTGFLGKHLIDGLLRDGHRVRSFDRCPPTEQSGSVEYITGDVRDYPRFLEASHECEIVFHLASIPSIARANYGSYFGINVLGTENVLRAALANGAGKVVHISSSTVYGIPRKCPLKEEDASDTVGYYGKSKTEAERLCWKYSTNDLTVSIIRPRVIMGPGRIGIFSLLFDAILRNAPVYLIGKGDNVFQFTGIDDMVNAVIQAANYNQTGVFNIGANDRTPVSQLIAALIKHAGSSSRIRRIPSPLVRTGLAAASLLGISPLSNEQFMIADKNFMLDTSRAEQQLGWHPVQSNFDCLREAFEWYRAHPPAHGQFRRLLGVLGRFRHSGQGAFQVQPPKKKRVKMSY